MTGTTDEPRFAAPTLLAFGRALLEAAGLALERATDVAEVLLEGDLLGHTTHGMALLSPYLGDLDAGRIEKEGEPEVISDRGATLCWDGRYLPGPWLVRRAIAAARERVPSHGLATIAVRRSHHIACLQAYLEPVTTSGLVMLLTCSDPSMASVVPHGGLDARMTPNPMAFGWPTEGAPVLVDISTSTTTNGMTKRLHDAGERLPAPWVIDTSGEATDDPGVLFAEPPGAILPLGELHLGHKGFGLGLLVEALTSGLAGFGRADGPTQWGASVFLMLLDPEAFGGTAAFVRETTALASACRDSPPRPGGPRVRLPGEAALARKRHQLSDGVQLHPGILASLQPWADRFGVAAPISA
jgi:L-lactate dehydrogenase